MKTSKGYINEGKVLIGLSMCYKGRIRDCHRCPYDSVGCGSRLTGDALRYILELERRLLEYEEKENKF